MTASLAVSLQAYDREQIPVATWNAGTERELDQLLAIGGRLLGIREGARFTMTGGPGLRDCFRRGRNATRAGLARD